MLQIEQLISVFSPHKCRICREESQSICGQCIHIISTAPASSCVVCNTLTVKFKLCTVCAKKSGLKQVWWSGRYEKQLKDVVWDFKFHRQRGLKKPLASLIYSSLPHDQFDLIAYVPSSTSRRRRRGYDHAELLANELSKLTNVPAKPVAHRVKNQRQVGTSKRDRWKQASIQFAVSSRHNLKDKNILLVDDVVTTGATLSAIAKLVKEAGAKSVSGVVIARG